MPFSKSIAFRIFGLALLLVFLMVTLAAFLLWQVSALNRDLQELSHYYAPLSSVVADVNEAGLRRRIAFERWFGALANPGDRAAAIKEASANYDIFTKKLNDGIQEAKQMLASPPPGEEWRPELHDVGTTLSQIAETYDIVNKRNAEVLELAKNGDYARAAQVVNILDDLQNILQKQRGDVERLMSSLVTQAGRDAMERHNEILWTTILATVTSVVLGLVVAAIITDWLVRPVRSLVSGIKTAEQGDLSVQVPVRSGDEIGILTRSFNFFITELRRKEEMRSIFGKYIDPRILDRVLTDPGAREEGGSRQNMAVSFADLAAFTSIGEQLTPTGVVNLLNKHFTLQAAAVQKHQGVVDKFMGDAVMAFWGKPFISTGDHAVLACAAALEQIEAARILRAALPEITGLRKNLPHVDLRLGISSGEVVVGTIGSENTRSYTVIGDTVNLAARLEKANRLYGTRVLLCETTRRLAGEAIVAREIGTLVVRGKTEETRVFELMGMTDGVSQDVADLCAAYTAALQAFSERQWDDAERLAGACLAIAPDDAASLRLRTRVQTYRNQPPPDDWNGAVSLSEK